MKISEISRLEGALFFYGVLVTVLLLLVLVQNEELKQRGTRSLGPDSAAVGKSFAPFEAVDFDNQAHSISFPSSKPLVLVALSGRCSICQDLLPQLNPVLSDSRSDFRVLGVTSDTLDNGGAILREECSFSVVRVDDATMNRLGLTAVPQVFVLGLDGKVRGKWVGFMSGDRLAELEALLSKWSDT